MDGNFFDGMVLLSTCDSIVPGHLMGCARLDIPAIVVTGGYMPLGTFRGKEVAYPGAGQSGRDGRGQDRSRPLQRPHPAQLGHLRRLHLHDHGKPMCMMAEAMGMTPAWQFIHECCFQRDPQPVLSRRPAYHGNGAPGHHRAADHHARIHPQRDCRGYGGGRVVQPDFAPAGHRARGRLRRALVEGVRRNEQHSAAAEPPDAGRRVFRQGL